MARWQNILKQAITAPKDLPVGLQPFMPESGAVADQYPMRINTYYLNLIKEKGDPLWLQAVPQPQELHDQVCVADPLDEENLSPVANLVHKYPDRVLFLVTSQCAMYCRFCTRKRKVGTASMVISDDTIHAGLNYIRTHPEIKDVLISGGDPLLLSDDRLDWLLSSIRAIPSVEIIRIGSRVPCTLPMRITAKLCRILKKYHPLYINTHFNHPDEITAEASLACKRLADVGIPLGCQTVLLKGVNDDATIMATLMRKLLTIRVKPYYLFQGDLTRGTNHFRTTIETGQKIMQQLIGHTSGMAVPTYAVDGPDGAGKIPLTPNYIESLGKQLCFTNYQGKTCFYDNGG
ncbi:MAG: KamA family radical SAM protein [Proteobacteria bacterium]|nr:KamA family radical SAM protein [Pseudomonadota bacterium]MBU1640353.1 KamA family radical SAM protein [Pseudomonadota bacterium]